MDTPTATELLADGALGVQEAVTFSGVSRAGLYRLMATGRLRFTRVGDRRLIPRKALVELLAKGLVANT